jgi:hypothetical protein
MDGGKGRPNGILAMKNVAPDLRALPGERDVLPCFFICFKPEE